MTLTPNFLPVGSIVEYNILIHNRWMPVRLSSKDIAQCENDNKHFNEFHRPIPLTPEILTEWCGFKPMLDTLYSYWSKDAGIFQISTRLPNGSYGLWTGSGTMGCFQYLHQLQHLYSALTQTVLPITIK